MRRRVEKQPFVKVVIEGKSYEVKKLIDYYDKGGKYKIVNRSSKYMAEKGRVRVCLHLVKKNHIMNRPQHKACERHRRNMRTKINTKELMRHTY